MPLTEDSSHKLCPVFDNVKQITERLGNVTIQAAVGCQVLSLGTISMNSDINMTCTVDDNEQNLANVI